MIWVLAADLTSDRLYGFMHLRRPPGAHLVTHPAGFDVGDRVYPSAVSVHDGANAEPPRWMVTASKALTCDDVDHSLVGLDGGREPRPWQPPPSGGDSTPVDS